MGRWNCSPRTETFGSGHGLHFGVQIHARLHQTEDLPDKAAEFTRNRHRDFVAFLATGQKLGHALVQPRLRFPRAGFDLFAQALLAGTEFFADFGAEPVVLRSFDQEPASMSVAGLGDSAAAFLFVTGVLA